MNFSPLDYLVVFDTNLSVSFFGHMKENENFKRFKIYIKVGFDLKEKIDESGIR